MSYQVTVTNVLARPTAVVPATTTWQEFPALWRELMDEVWACLHAGGINRGCRNMMLYWDDVPHVEVGVELLVPCPLTGRVVASALPAGQVAMTVHRGPYSGLAAAHRAVLDWWATQRRSCQGVDRGLLPVEMTALFPAACHFRVGDSGVRTRTQSTPFVHGFSVMVSAEPTGKCPTKWATATS